MNDNPIPDGEHWVHIPSPTPMPKVEPSPATDRARREAEENIARAFGIDAGTR